MSDVEPIPVVIAPASGRAWMLEGACHSMTPAERERFYPPYDDVPADVRRTCASCPVQMECLDYALVHGEHYGVWGGTGERERRSIARNVHGTPDRYTARRCRCAACSEAVAAWRATARATERIVAAVREAYGLTA